ncbi:MAG: hypothetical protein WBA74_07915 [Cyclobacteriaceae bacterium]
MKAITFLMIIICISFEVVGQENKLAVFDQMVGKTWRAEGKWKDGSDFKQEVTIEYALDSTLVISKTKSFTDEKQQKFGMRNYGIRKYDSEKDEILFWEFDITNSLTEGKVKVKGKNVYFIYTYGYSLVTDGWEYRDDNSYILKIGVFDGENWEKTYLEVVYTLVDE